MESKQSAPGLAGLLSFGRTRSPACPPDWQISITGWDAAKGEEFSHFSDNSGWRFIDLWNAMTKPERRGIDRITIELVPSRGVGWAQRFVSERDARDGGSMAPFRVADRGFARSGTEVMPKRTWAKHLAKINDALSEEEGGE